MAASIDSKFTPDDGWLTIAPEGVGNYCDTADNIDLGAAGASVHVVQAVGEPSIEANITAEEPGELAPGGPGALLIVGTEEPTWSLAQRAREFAVPAVADATRPNWHALARAAGLVEAYEADFVADNDRLLYTLLDHVDLTDSAQLRKWLVDTKNEWAKYREIKGARCGLQITGEAGKPLLFESLDGKGTGYSQGDVDVSGGYPHTVSYNKDPRILFQGATITVAEHVAAAPKTYTGPIPYFQLRIGKEVALHPDGKGTNGTGEVTNIRSTYVELDIKMQSRRIAQWDFYDFVRNRRVARIGIDVPGPKTDTNRFGFFLYGQPASNSKEEIGKVMYETVTFRGMWPESNEAAPVYDAGFVPASILSMYVRSENL